MKHARILLHAILALLPVLGGRWIVREAFFDSGMVHGCVFNCALVYLILVVLGVGAFIPQVVLVAARNARHASVDHHWKKVPVHPVGLITIFGTWGHIPALWLASHLSGDRYSVSFSFLGPPLIVASVVLAWRYVVKNEPPSPPRSKGGEIDGLGPAPDDF